ncbi:acetate--CoA ligase family protein [Plantactinospora soyae]|uniref:Acetyltransferase n=1 Tax=Plantactinospora soyae TaxID=1544732 RepID=A0A927R989_9ACTN|nr:acetate--CoA ligase family protein [Plantactinospora soyae]MBE1489541.1 acetyltransferase [Plantactinospora soyae]
MQTLRYESIRYLLRPASIAVVGASDRPDRIGGRPLRILAERGYRGSIYPVNPKYESVQGMRCYPDIASLPADVELFVICIPAEAAVAALEEAAERGARAAVVFGGGFAESGADGKALQDRLSQIAESAGIALAGPNSLGLASFAHRSFATFATTLETMPAIEAGGVALVSQSGGTAFNLLTEAYWAGGRFSHVIATGNEAGVTFPDYLRYLATDPATSAVIGYVEGVASGEQLAVALGELQSAGKPVFLLKSGASERGSRSVASHTAQFSGVDSAFDAVFDRFGAVRLRGMDDAVDVARALTIDTPVDGLAVATNSGGAAAYLSDACDRFGVPLTDLTDDTMRALRAALPAFAGLTNPIDFTAQVINDVDLMANTLRILDRDPSVDTLLVFLGSMEYLGEDLIDILVRTRAELRNPLVLSWLGVSDRIRLAAAQAGLVVGADPARALRGMGLVRAARRGQRQAPGRSGSTTAVDLGGTVGDDLPRFGNGQRQGLDEARAMELLDRLGVRTPRRVEVTTGPGALAAAEKVGYPCVLKLVEPFLAHRARQGAVEVGLDGPDRLAAAYERMTGQFGMTKALVVEQVPAGPELIVGVLADATFGSRAVLGSGGIWANEIDDVRTLVPPYDPAYVEHELRRLKLAAQFEGQAAVDVPGLAKDLGAVLARLDAVVRDEAVGIGEIECNPIRVVDGGTVVLDALAFTTGEAGR